MFYLGGMETLTVQEEQLMQLIWRLERALIRDILNELPDPKPPYTTLASNIKNLEKKGFLGKKAYGNTFEYFPLVSQGAYGKRSFHQVIQNYFNGSMANVLSFMVKEKGISQKEIEELQKLIDNNFKEEA